MFVLYRLLSGPALVERKTFSGSSTIIGWAQYSIETSQTLPEGDTAIIIVKLHNAQFVIDGYLQVEDI